MLCPFFYSLCCMHCFPCKASLTVLYASCCTLTELILYASGVYFAQLKCKALSAIICAHLNHLSGVMKLLTIEPNVQDSVIGRELFRPRPKTALWKRPSHQLAVSLNQRLSLPCPWGWRLSHPHPSAARAWQVHLSNVSCLRSARCPMLPSLAAMNLTCNSNCDKHVI